MKSKTSCFNFTLFRKNVTLFWPLWVIYLLVLLYLIPGSLWLRFQYILKWNQDISQSDAYEVVGNVLDLQTGLLIVCAMALLTGMAVFHYLFQARSANMMHAFPVTRGELYVTNLITGLAFLIVPLILTFLLGVMVCLGFGAPQVEYMGIWLLVMVAYAVFMFSLVVFCAMLTGQLFAVPVFFLALNLIYVGICALVRMVVVSMGYGLSFEGFRVFKASWLSPLYYLLRRVFFRVHYVLEEGGRDYYCDEIAFVGGGAVAIYFAVGLVLFAVSYLIYKKRQMEKAGDLVVFSWMKPVLRWGAGIGIGVFLAWLGEYVVYDALNHFSVAFYLVEWALFGALGFLIAEMFVQKKFKVFSKRFFGEGAAFLVLMFAVFGGSYYEAYKETFYIPDAEQIASASVDDYINVTVTGDEIDSVMEMHRLAVENRDVMREYANSDEESRWFSITYKLKNGKTVSRNYNYPIKDETMELTEKLLAFESDPEHFVQGFLPGLYEMEDQYDYASLQIYDSDWYYSEDREADGADVQKLVKAIQRDVEEGNLQSCALYPPKALGGGEKSYAAYLEVRAQRQYMDEIEQADSYYANVGAYVYYYGNDESGYMEDVMYNNSDIWICFNEDCTNIIEALLDTGLLKSVDELALEE